MHDIGCYGNYVLLLCMALVGCYGKYVLLCMVLVAMVTMLCFYGNDVLLLCTALVGCYGNYVLLLWLVMKFRRSIRVAMPKIIFVTVSEPSGCTKIIRKVLI